MMRALQNLSLPVRILVYAVAAAIVLAVAAGLGATAALVLGPDGGPLGGEKPQRTAGEATARRTSEQAAQGNASDGKSGTEYLSKVADIQDGSVEAAIKSNDMLVRYDSLTADDIRNMEANYAALRDYSDRVEELNPPEEYEDQYKVFVLAIDSLREANKLAYRLAVDPASATQADFETYDRHIDRATSYLRQSNEMLDRHYKTTEAAQKVSLG